MRSPASLSFCTGGVLDCLILQLCCNKRALQSHESRPLFFFLLLFFPTKARLGKLKQLYIGYLGILLYSGFLGFDVTFDDYYYYYYCGVRTCGFFPVPTSSTFQTASLSKWLTDVSMACQDLRHTLWQHPIRWTWQDVFIECMVKRHYDEALDYYKFEIKKKPPRVLWWWIARKTSRSRTSPFLSTLVTDTRLGWGSPANTRFRAAFKDLLDDRIFQLRIEHISRWCRSRHRVSCNSSGSCFRADNILWWSRRSRHVFVLLPYINSWRS